MASKVTKTRPDGATVSRTSPYDWDPKPIQGCYQKNIIISDELKITKRCKTKVSEEEFKYLSCVVYHETNSEPYEGKLAMANIIINRYYNDCDGIFPHSISGIIFQEGQFMASDPEFAQNWKDTVTIYEKGGFTTENHLLCLRAIYDALNGKNNIGTRIITSVYITEKNKGHRNAIRIQNNMFWDREDVPW